MFHFQKVVYFKYSFTYNSSDLSLIYYIVINIIFKVQPKLIFILM